MKQTIIEHFSNNFYPFYGKYLPEIKKDSGNSKFKAVCPFHPDKDPSFTFKATNGLFKCFGCDAKGDIFSFYAKKHNLNTRLNFPDVLTGICRDFGIPIPEPKSKTTFKKTDPFIHYRLGKPVEKYPYKNLDGKTLYYNCRFEPKTFRQCSADGRSWKVKDIKTKVPYQLQKVIETKNPFVVEGERDCHGLAKFNFVGTCNVAGAGNWTSDLNEHFKDKDIILIPDNDDAGFKHIDKVYHELKGVALSIKVIYLPGLPENGDFTDWLNTFKGDLNSAKKRFGMMVEGAELYKSKTEDNKPEEKKDSDLFFFDSIELVDAASLMKIKFPKPRWAIEGIIPEGVGILAGKPKTGKSVLTLNISLAVSIGGKALGVDVEQGTVLYLHLEDNLRRIQKRIEAMLPYDEFSGTHSRAPESLCLSPRWPRMGEGGLRALDYFLNDHKDIRLVIIDTLKMFQRNLKKSDQGKVQYEIDYDRVSMLRPIAEKYNVAILIIHHTRKASSDDPIDLISGTFGISGAIDNFIVMHDRKNNRVKLHVQGRDIDQVEYTLEYAPEIWTWQMLGESYRVMNTDNQQAVLDFLTEFTSKDKPATLDEIVKGSKVNKSTAQVRVLPKLMKENLILSPKKGRYAIFGP